MSPNNKEIIIFTDGASRGNPGPGGWGAIVVMPDEGTAHYTVREMGGSEKTTTNNRMELKAAIESLASLAEDKTFPITVYTDSRYLIEGITKWVYSWEHRNWETRNKEAVLNKDLWEELLKYTSQNIEWKHLSGHAGIVGNERADALATSFADGKTPKLFSGSLSQYKINILDLKENQLKKRSSKTKRSQAPAYSYVSEVGGVIKTHKSWVECEKRVKGKSKARFKKALNKEEEKSIINEWKRV